MKRLLSLLVVIAMVVAMIPNVFAAKEDVDFDELTGRLVVLESISAIEVALAEGSDGMIYQWTPSANCNLSLSYTAPEGTEIAVTVTQGEASAVAVDGAVNMDVWADQVVEIEVSEAAAKAAEFTIEGTDFAVPGSDEQNSIFLGQMENTVTAAGTTFSGNTTWYHGYFSGTVMTITGTGAYNVSYNGQTIAAVDGVVSTAVASANPRMPVVFAIDTVGEYTISFAYPAGTQANPVALVMGQNVASIAAGNNQGYYFTWTAEQEGTLILTMPSDMGWTYVVNNLTSYVYGDTQWSDDPAAANPAEIAVAAGDELMIVVNTYDPADAWNTPAGDLVITAAFQEPAPPAPSLVITAQPQSVVAAEGDKVTFSVVAEGEGLTYQWWYKNATDTAFKTSGAATAKTPNFDAAPSAGSGYHGREYYCVITDAAGNSVQTETVSLQVKFLAEVTPTKNWPANSTATLKAVWSRDGEAGVTYRWYYSKDGGQTWGTTGMTGCYTSTLSVATDLPGRSGYRYKCLITDNGVEYWSTPVILYIAADPAVITQHPVDATVRAGYKTTFSVKAEGFGLSYQWQWSNDGINWSNSTGSGYATDTLTVGSNNYNGGRYYRCKVYTIKGSAWEEVISGVAQMTVTPAVEIAEQPQSVTVKAGETAVFHVGLAEGEEAAVPVAYQWQWAKWAGNWMNTGKEGNKTDTVYIDNVSAEMNGRYYVCLIYNGTEAGWIYSDTVQLFVEP